MSLLNLPNEIVILISSHLDNCYCINAFVRSCRRFYLLLNRSLYEQDSPYQIALKWGLQKGLETTVRYALEAGASADEFSILNVPSTIDCPMYTACARGNDGIVRSLIDHGISEKSGIAGMRMAAGNGHDEVVRLLVSRGISPRFRASRGDSPLNMAVRNGHLPTVKLLISLGCDAYVQGFFGPTLPFDAALQGYEEVLQFLVTDANLDPPLVDHMAICAAASNGHGGIVEILLQCGAKPILEREDVKLMPLILAAKREHYAIAERLRRSIDLQTVIAGGEPDDKDHKMLLLVSAACGWTDIIGDLIDNGCPIDFEEPRQPDLGDRCAHLESGWFLYNRPTMSPLALAANRGRLDVVDQLLARNSDLRADANKDAISWAIEGGHLKIIEMLLDNLEGSGHYPDAFPSSVLEKVVQSLDVLQLSIERGVFHDNLHFRGLIEHAVQTGAHEALNILTQGPASQGQPMNVKEICGAHLLTKAVPGGVSMVKFVLDNDLPVDERDVQRAAENIVSRSDFESLELFFQRGLITRPVTASGKGLIGLVDSKGAGFNSVAATLDLLLKHGADINGDLHPSMLRMVTKGPRSFQPNSPGRRQTFLQLLLDRGADPLKKCKVHGSPFLTAAINGEHALLKLMLNALSQRDISFDELQSTFRRAGRKAEENGHFQIPRILRRSYWRRKFELEQMT